MRKELPDTQYLREIFEDLGDTLRWRVKRRGVRRGGRVTTQNAHGYLVVGIDGQRYFVHRVLWKIRTGEEPPRYLDHIDNNKLNNAPDNLQAVTQSENSAKEYLRGHVRTDSTSGVTGVSFRESKGYWEAYIDVRGKRRRSSGHPTPEAAVEARDDLCRRFRPDLVEKYNV